MGRVIRNTTVGMVGLLAIAGGTVATATPSWAETIYTVSNYAPGIYLASLGGTQAGIAVACGPDCSLGGNSKAVFLSGSPVNGYGTLAFPLQASVFFNAHGNVTAGMQALIASNPIATPVSAMLVSDYPYFDFAVSTKGTMTCRIFSGSGFWPQPTKAIAQPVYSQETCLLENFPADKTSDAALPGQRRATKAVHVRMTTNKAVVKKGNTIVKITPYALKKSKITEKIVLRNANGKVIGKSTRHVTAGKATNLKVPLPQHLRKKVNAGKDITVTARVTHVDKTRGTGHRTTKLILTKS